MGEATCFVDDQGMLPLHLALRNEEVDDEVVKCLVKGNPRGLLVKDNKGRIPVEMKGGSTLKWLELMYLERDDKDSQKIENKSAPNPVNEDTNRLTVLEDKLRRISDLKELKEQQENKLKTFYEQRLTDLKTELDKKNDLISEATQQIGLQTEYLTKHQEMEDERVPELDKIMSRVHELQDQLKLQNDLIFKQEDQFAKQKEQIEMLKSENESLKLELTEPKQMKLGQEKQQELITINKTREAQINLLGTEIIQLREDNEKLKKEAAEIIQIKEENEKLKKAVIKEPMLSEELKTKENTDLVELCKSRESQLNLLRDEIVQLKKINVTTKELCAEKDLLISKLKTLNETKSPEFKLRTNHNQASLLDNTLDEKEKINEQEVEVIEKEDNVQCNTEIHHIEQEKKIIIMKQVAQEQKTVIIKQEKTETIDIEFLKTDQHEEKKETMKYEPIATSFSLDSKGAHDSKRDDFLKLISDLDCFSIRVSQCHSVDYKKATRTLKVVSENANKLMISFARKAFEVTEQVGKFARKKVSSLKLLIDEKGGVVACVTEADYAKIVKCDG